MSNLDRPLVSIVTPVHNGARYLAECIESVMMQGYACFEHVIVDNASSDETRAIAAAYATRDARIRVVECAEKLPIIANWNRALGFISDESRYVWVLPADDALIGESLSSMMKIALQNASVGVVASLRLRGRHIECSGLDPDREVFTGREIVQLFLREEVFAFSPTGSLLRRDLIDARQPFYPDRYLHADTAAFFDVLDQVDFGFVHKVLMFSREHEGSMTSVVANRKGTQFRDGLLMLKEFGQRYFEPEELAEIEARFLRRYYRFLVRSAILLRERELFEYHGRALNEAGCSPSINALVRAAASELERAVLKPLRAAEYVRTRLHWHDRLDHLWDERSVN
ncbi:MAG TPA: glycosyltransferase family 2 protein [Woeseiaceae bacterium]|jgi:glycosyltransferase involved in cell wall biosynthesis|nr:glycosyltransferase family 2 protein [Woeseiaceae bacterium]